MKVTSVQVMQWMEEQECVLESVDRHLGCCHLLAIANHAAENTHVQIFV